MNSKAHGRVERNGPAEFMNAMSRFRSYLTAFVMTATVSLLPIAVSAQEGKVDLTGKWQLSVKTSAGTGAPTLTLKQHGDSPHFP